MFTSDDVPPYRYVLTVDIGDLAQLGRDVEGEEMRGAALRASPVR